MKIRRNSKELPEIFARAKNIRVYSLNNCFVGKLLAGDTQQDYLAETFRETRFAELTRNNGTFTLHIHSNLWYEFEN